MISIYIHYRNVDYFGTSHSLTMLHVLNEIGCVLGGGIIRTAPTKGEGGGGAVIKAVAFVG